MDNMYLPENIEIMCSSTGLRAAFLQDDGTYSYDPVVALCVVDDGNGEADIAPLVLCGDIGITFCSHALNYSGLCPMDIPMEKFKI